MKVKQPTLIFVLLNFIGTSYAVIDWDISEGLETIQTGDECTRFRSEQVGAAQIYMLHTECGRNYMAKITSAVKVDV